VPFILGRRSSRQAIGFSSTAPPTTGDLITYRGDGHLVTFAPTGTGKTSGPVICNALTHPGQLIVIDMKGEVHAATAEARTAMGQRIHVLDMRDGADSDALNPLDLAAKTGTEPAAIGRSFAAELLDRNPKETDRFWNDFAESIIAGGVAWMLADCEDATMSGLFDIFNLEDPVYGIARIMDGENIRDRSAKAAFAAFLNLPEKETRPSVLGTVQTHLRLFDSDLTRRLTDETTMDLDGLIAGKPMSLYVIVPPFRLTAYRPLLRMWLSGLILTLMQRKSPPKDRTLILCDEVGNLGRIDALLTAATLMRSWGITLWTFWQNVGQLQVYDAQANTIVDNAGVVQVFGARNLRMAQELANLIGGVSPEEILRMPHDEQILLIEGKMTRCRQARYYSDKMFTKG
jgi:type IV secretion system protein VirD4